MSNVIDFPTFPETEKAQLRERKALREIAANKDRYARQSHNTGVLLRAGFVNIDGDPTRWRPTKKAFDPNITPPTANC